MQATTEPGVIPVRKPHDHQRPFVESTAKRSIVKAGRRGGKTVGMALKAIKRFNAGQRVLYTAPTAEQTDSFWYEIARALAEPIKDRVLKEDRGERYIEVPGTKQRIKAKTAWSADTLRGDYADFLIFDEYQLTNEDAWEVVGAPMLLDNDGDAAFIYTPPSLRTAGVSKAHDPRHASKMFKRAEERIRVSLEAGAVPRWATFHFASHANPHLSTAALAEITEDMSVAAYRQEILAEDDDIEESWLVYGAFDEASQVIPRYLLPKEWPRYTGHDFGGANPACLFIAQDPATGNFFAYHEYVPGGGRSAYEHVVEFKRLTEGVTVLKRVGGSHQEGEIREAYRSQGWNITEPTRKADQTSGPGTVLAQIDRVRGLMEHNRLFVFEDLIALREELANCLWDIGPDGRPLDGKVKDASRFHLLDCLRYVASEFKVELASVPGAGPRTVRPRRGLR